MGMYDNYDPEMANKGVIILFVFTLALCLIMVSANLFVGAGIAWKWVFAPIWGPIVFGLILKILGFQSPRQ